MRRLSLLLIAVALGAASGSCGPGFTSMRGGGGGGGAGYSAQCRGDFGAGAAASQFESFMAATYEFHEAATSVQTTMLDACVRMGRALEMDASALSGSGPEGTRAVCDAVSSRLRSEMQAVQAASQTTVELRTQPPRCEASFEAYADCAARCEANVDPGSVELTCEGGEIRGTCSGQCSGSCAVDVQAQCTGRCEGVCEGTCSARAADGSCAGTCNGTCRGQCVAQASGGCQGECRGACSVEWQRPYCTGHVRPPQVSAECRASCEARVDAHLECRPGRAELVVTGGPDEATQARAARVRAAIADGLATVLEVRQRVERLRESGQAVIAQMQSLPEAIRSVGISAAACSAGALADLRDSMASVSVTFEVSVSVSASASVSG
ncbi:MAG: hypothetical protein IT378_07205 [Sandaracinaceae bacterium]|nr:hypothetical protein [Sandaracinaceae bacterium]